MTVPERSEIVIIGGGVVGASIAYHLAQRGKTDVTLVERKSLTNGSTWHAAGLVGQLRSSSNLTQLMRKSVETYQTLEDKTGYATGWRDVGGVRVASSPERWEELQRVYTQGKSYGFDIHLVSPAEARSFSRSSTPRASTGRPGPRRTGTSTPTSSPTPSSLARAPQVCV